MRLAMRTAAEGLLELQSGVPVLLLQRMPRMMVQGKSDCSGNQPGRSAPARFVDI